MYVQLTEAVEFCCSFLLAKICLENCAEVMRLLEDFSVGVEGVQEQLDNFLLDNFVPLMSRPDFLSYLGLERLQVCWRAEGVTAVHLLLQMSLSDRWSSPPSSPRAPPTAGVPEQRRFEPLPGDRAVRGGAGVATARPPALEAHRYHRPVRPLLPHVAGRHL